MTGRNTLTVVPLHAVRCQMRLSMNSIETFLLHRQTLFQRGKLTVGAPSPCPNPPCSKRHDNPTTLESRSHPRSLLLRASGHIDCTLPLSRLGKGHQDEAAMSHGLSCSAGFNNAVSLIFPRRSISLLQGRTSVSLVAFSKSSTTASRRTTWSALSAADSPRSG